MKSRTLWILVALFLVLEGGLVLALWQTRVSVLDQFSRPEEIQQWNDFRESMAARNEEAGPVQARNNPSAIPPILVLFGENFATLITGTIVFSSILYWMLVIMTWGAMNTPSPVTEPEDSL